MGKQRILVVGAGVIGRLFAGKLAAAGHSVTLVARGETAKLLKKEGLILQETGDGVLRIRVPIIESIDERMYDVALVCMQRQQVDEALPLIDRIRSNTLVFMVNNATGYAPWIERYGTDRLMIGFPSAGGVREGNGVRIFVGRGAMRLLQTTTFGEVSGEHSNRLKRWVRTVSDAGIPSTFTRRMDDWQRTHVGLILPICKALELRDFDRLALAGDRRLLDQMIRSIQETFRALESHGFRVSPTRLKALLLPAGILRPFFSFFLRTSTAEVAIVQHAACAGEEMARLERDLLAVLGDSPLPHLQKLLSGR